MKNETRVACGKISKYHGVNDGKRKALVIEIISFSEGMGLDVLKVFQGNILGYF